VINAEAGLQLLKLLDDYIAVTLDVVALEAEQASRVITEAFCELDKRRA
jgi:hypothetical protein